MNEDFFGLRLAKLREAKNISAREMSLSIGQNRNYINQIENRKAFPTMQLFFYICEYLNITPQEFFDAGNTQPERLKYLISGLDKLDDNTLNYISGIVDKLNSK